MVDKVSELHALHAKQAFYLTTITRLIRTLTRRPLPCRVKVHRCLSNAHAHSATKKSLLTNLQFVSELTEQTFHVIVSAHTRINN